MNGIEVITHSEVNIQNLGDEVHALYVAVFTKILEFQKKDFKEGK